MKKTNKLAAILLAVLTLSVFLFNSCEKTASPSSDTTNTQEPTESTMSAKIYFIKMEDKGANGELIGCDDSVIGEDSQIPSSTDATVSIKNALDKLLSIKERDYGDQKLYNSLSNLDLKVDNVIASETRIQVMLSGTYQISGVCEIPRIKAQLMQTASQFKGDLSIDILINGRLFDEVFSLKGE